MSDEKMTADDEPKRGWGFPLNSRKAHFFDGDMISVCRKWMYTGPLDPADSPPSPDDCATCSKKVRR